MKLKTIVPLLTVSLLAACVTVNVNFPESAVQKATDDYVRDLYRAKEKGKTPAPTDPATVSSPKAGIWSTPQLFSRLAWITESLADEGDVFRVDTSKALDIRENLRTRLAEVIAQKRAGVVGETNDGMVKLQDPSKLKPLLLKKVEKLVADENRDRESLYEEIVRANSLPKARMKNVQKSFARSFQAESPSGTWVESTDGRWAQKP